MGNKIAIKSILLLIIAILSTIGFTGCGPIIPIPSVTTTLHIDINDNYTYQVYIDDVLWGTTDWNGDITLYNVPLGNHTIYVQSTAFPFYCMGNADINIQSGINSVYISVFCVI